MAEFARNAVDDGNPVRRVGLWIGGVGADVLGGEGPGRLEARTRLYAQARGWEVGEIYRPGSRADLDSTARGARMLADLHAGRISGLVVPDLAEFATDRSLWSRVAEVHQTQGAVLVSLAQGIDSSTPAGVRLLPQFSVDAQPTAGRVALFEGRVTCSCGAPMRAVPDVTVYRCEACRSEVAEGALEAAFHADASAHRPSDDVFAADLAQTADALQRKEDVLTGVLVERRALAGLLAGSSWRQRQGDRVQASPVSPDDLAKLERLKHLDERIPALQSELDVLRVRQAAIEAMQAVAPDLDVPWPVLPFERKRRMVHTLAGRLRVAAGGIRVRLQELPPAASAGRGGSAAPPAPNPDAVFPAPEVPATTPSDLGQTAIAEFAADGFPIDPSLRVRARRAVWSYSLLAGYYVLMAALLMKDARWGSLQHLAQDVAFLGGFLMGLLGYFVANVALAIAAWHVMSMYRWATWVVAVVSGGLALWVWSQVTLSALRWLAPNSGGIGLTTLISAVFLVIAYSVGAYLLIRPIMDINRRRTQVLRQLVGVRPV